MRVSNAAPSLLQPLHTDEYIQPPPSAETVGAIKGAHLLAENAMTRSDETFWASRQGTAAGLIALNQQFGNEFYRVPLDAVDDVEAANEALGGSQVVIDVQTHYVSDQTDTGRWLGDQFASYRAAMPSWWKNLDGMTSYNFSEYLRCVFVESETAVAILTSGPGRGPERLLYNSEMAGTRRLLDELGPRGRLLNHAVVHPTYDDDLEDMQAWQDALNPVGWKVYTMGELKGSGRQGAIALWKEGTEWMLDDERGFKFLDRVREVGGNKLICAHKGLANLVNSGSPRDVGPAARAYPDLKFLIYHSGYEWPMSEVEEGPYSEDEAELGSNRLVKTLADNGIAPGSNVYAELGTTWFLLTRRPREAAHVLGKLLLAVGPDNVVWGTDSCWYGSVQPLIDAFRAFQIPLNMQQQFGYPALTDEIKDKILSRNAAAVYDIDLDQARENSRNDDLVWIKDAVNYYRKKGTLGSRS
jgi:uncharacterized protein